MCVGSKFGFGIYWDTINDEVGFYKKLGYNLNPLNLDEAFGSETGHGMSFDYSPSKESFFGDSTEYSIPLGPVGADFATSYRPGLPQMVSWGFDIGFTGTGASMMHMTTSPMPLEF